MAGRPGGYQPRDSQISAHSRVQMRLGRRQFLGGFGTVTDTSARRSREASDLTGLAANHSAETAARLTLQNGTMRRQTRLIADGCHAGYASEA